MKVGDLIKDRAQGRTGIVISRQPKVVSRSKGPVVVNYYRVRWADGQVGRVCPVYDDHMQCIEVINESR